MEPLDILDRALTPTGLPDSPQLLVGTALALALLLVVPGAVWRLTGIVVTIVHELGHGCAGLLTGRRAVAIRLSPDHSGLTTSHGRAASVPWTTFWGYPAPCSPSRSSSCAGSSPGSPSRSPRRCCSASWASRRIRG